MTDQSPRLRGAIAASAPASSRASRLRLAAAARGVPLPTILVTVSVVVAVYLLGKLVYGIRGVLLLMLIAGFLALVLNPFVAQLQRWRVHRRGHAVGVVVGLGLVVFLGLAWAFGAPLTSGVTHLAQTLPSSVRDAEQGHGVIGRLAQDLHLQKFVTENSPKLQELGSNLAKPAVAFGKGTAVLIGEMFAILSLVILFLLEGPRMRTGILGLLEPQRAAWCQRVATEIRRAVVGFVVGDLATSLVAGVVVGSTMALLGLPFPWLWALWVALVDFLPQVGGALAGIPTILFAATQSLTSGIVLAIVFIAYQQLENHVLNPIIMSRTVRTSPLLIMIAVLVGGAIGAEAGGVFGAIVVALLAVPVAASLQILVREIWRLTGA